MKSCKSQIAVFLIVAIVVLLTATMVTVNIGKIALTKTRTGNASDAGCIAGCSIHSITLNVIAWQNTKMFQEYLAELAIFAVPKTICQEPKWRAEWAIWDAAQAAWYGYIWDQIGSPGYQAAEDTAKQFAYSNSGIDEAKVRLPLEPYLVWLQRKSNFEEWMDDEEYKNHGSYSWTDTQGGLNKVEVDVDAPHFPGLIPEPGALIGVYLDEIPICIPCSDCCVACELKVGELAGCYNEAGATATACPESNSLFCGEDCCDCEPMTGLEVTGGETSWGTTVIINGAYFTCGTVVSSEIIYPCPIVYIYDIVSDNPEIEVETTRIEASRDLGLWNMQYNTSLTKSGVTSKAKAKTSGGSVAGPIGNPSYDCELKDTDGE